MEGVLKQRGTRHAQLDVRGERVGLAEVAELVQLPAKGALVLGGHTVGALGAVGATIGAFGAVEGGATRARILKGRRPRVVVHKIAHPVLRVPWDREGI